MSKAISLLAFAEARRVKESLGGILEESFDKGALNTNIEQRLDGLESQYAPRLTGAEAAIGENYTALTRLMDDFTYLPPVAILSLATIADMREYGDELASIDLEATITKKSLDVKKVEFYRDSVPIATVSDPNEDGGKVAFTEENRVGDTTNFKVRAYDDKSHVEATQTISFVYPTYVGALPTNTTNQTQIKDLTKLVKGKSNTEYTFTLRSSRFIYAYPKSYGLLKSITDPSGFESLGSYNRTEVSITGLDNTTVMYYVYTFKTETSQTNFTKTFKF